MRTHTASTNYTHSTLNHIALFVPADAASATSIAGAGLRIQSTPTGVVTLETTGFHSALKLNLFDAFDRVPSSEMRPANSGAATHTLSLSGAATGVYLLRLSNANGVGTRRVVHEQPQSSYCKNPLVMPMGPFLFSN